MQEAHTSSSLLKGRPGIKGESGGQTWEPLVAVGPEVSRELSEAESSRPTLQLTERDSRRTW